MCFPQGLLPGAQVTWVHCTPTLNNKGCCGMGVGCPSDSEQKDGLRKPPQDPVRRLHILETRKLRLGRAQGQPGVTQRAQGGIRTEPALPATGHGIRPCSPQRRPIWMVMGDAGKMPPAGSFLWKRKTLNRHAKSNLHDFTNWRASSEVWAGNRMLTPSRILRSGS